MAFSKSFPRNVEGSSYPSWEEVFLSEEEESKATQKASEEHVALMKECISDAKKIAIEKGLKDYQTDLIHIAIALFEKRASHTVYHKERMAKEKFDNR